jgi:hypothetical protein
MTSVVPKTIKRGTWASAPEGTLTVASELAQRPQGSVERTFMAKKMELKNQILLVNAAVLAGLVFEYFRGVPIFAIAIAGVFLLMFVNVIFWVRMQRAKKAL